MYEPCLIRVDENMPDLEGLELHHGVAGILGLLVVAHRLLVEQAAEVHQEQGRLIDLHPGGQGRKVQVGQGVNLAQVFHHQLPDILGEEAAFTTYS